MVVVLCAVWGWTATTPAGAHDVLVASSPAADEHLDAAPTSVLLRFGGTPLAMGSTIIVMDPNGEDWIDARPVVTGSEVSAELRAGMPDGNYQARWRVVSEDGAVISGFFDFSVGEVDGAATIPTPRSDDSAAQRPPDGDAAGDFATVTGPSETATPERDWGRLIAAGGLGAFAGVGLVTAAAAGVARRRTDRTADQIDTSGGSEPPPTSDNTDTREEPS